MNIPIKKHTKVRRPMSNWKLTIDYSVHNNYITCLSTDITSEDIRKLENPLYCRRITSVAYTNQLADEILIKQQKGDWNERHEDMHKIKRGKLTGYTPYKSLADELNKPKSLWQRIKDKL